MPSPVSMSGLLEALGVHPDNSWNIASALDYGDNPSMNAPRGGLSASDFLKMWLAQRQQQEEARWNPYKFRINPAQDRQLRADIAAAENELGFAGLGQRERKMTGDWALGREQMKAWERVSQAKEKAAASKWQTEEQGRNTRSQAENVSREEIARANKEAMLDQLIYGNQEHMNRLLLELGFKERENELNRGEKALDRKALQEWRQAELGQKETEEQGRNTRSQAENVSRERIAGLSSDKQDKQLQAQANQEFVKLLANPATTPEVRLAAVENSTHPQAERFKALAKSFSDNDEEYYKNLRQVLIWDKKGTLNEKIQEARKAKSQEQKLSGLPYAKSQEQKLSGLPFPARYGLGVARIGTAPARWFFGVPDLPYLDY